jgi:hypothetical protein
MVRWGGHFIIFAIWSYRYSSALNATTAIVHRKAQYLPPMMMPRRAWLVLLTIALATATADEDDDDERIALPDDDDDDDDVVAVVSPERARPSHETRAHHLRRRLPSSYFNVRLYWKDGYRWQGSTSEKFWCMKCQSSGCDRGSGVKISKCDRDDRRQHFFFDDGRIRTRRNLDVCLERSGRSIIFKGCDGSNDQVWDTLRKDEPFMLQIPGNDSKCASQHHHPKDGEVLYMASCKLASDNDTGRWIVY